MFYLYYSDEGKPYFSAKKIEKNDKKVQAKEEMLNWIFKIIIKRRSKEQIRGG